MDVPDADGRYRDVDGERAWRRAVWRHLQSTEDARGWVRPAVLREWGAYGGGQGIWVDARRTASLCPGGVAVSVLHTGAHYPDDLTEDGLIYHYPRTHRGQSRDTGEVQAMKSAAEMRIPIFVVTKPVPSSSWRQVRLGWIEGWDDATATFLITFMEQAPAHVADVDRSDEEPFQLEGNRSIRTAGRVRRRPGQQRFKFRVLQRYGPRCPLSGVTVPVMLEAAHLRGDADGGTDDPRNGLPLNASLHRAFDAHLFGINPDTLTVETCPGGATLTDLGIQYPSLSGLGKLPHPEALKWRYQSWLDSLRT